jgi:pimeloyl-ACP methyl ester carboxylesterase
VAEQTRNRSSRLTDLATRLTLGTGVGYVAAAYAVSHLLTKPTRRRIRESPADFGLDFEPIECQTEDRVRLRGWLVEPTNPRGTVALFHGMRGTRLNTLERIRFLAAGGYRCVAFDHRAHGESGGKRTSFGFLESRDAAAVATLVRDRWPDSPRAALGISMGAAALCYSARRSPLWDALVLEGLYRDIATAFRNRIGTQYPAWFRRLYGGVVWMTEHRLRLRMHQLAPIHHVNDLRPAPVLFVTGVEDKLAPPTDAMTLRDTYAGPCELWLVPGAGHTDVCQLGGDAYRWRVLDFLDRALGQAAPARRAA